MTLNDLQQKLAQEKIDAALITRNNMFLGQDVLPEENKIRELSGFTGSQGTMLVTPQQAWLIVDGRYAIQARRETNSHEITVVDYPYLLPQIARLCRTNNIRSLAYNPWCLSLDEVRTLKQILVETTLLESENLTGEILSKQPVDVFEHDVKFAGLSAEEKSNRIIAKLAQKFDAILLTSAEDVSWLTNLRSHTLEDTPILRAFALLGRDGKIQIYADHCVSANIKPLSALSADLKPYIGKIVLTQALNTPAKILSLIPEGVNLETIGYNPIRDMKLSKNPIELEGFRHAHIRDGVAVTKFLYWLRQNWQETDEWQAAQKLNEFRRQQPLYFSDSFKTIAAAGANAAMVHYQPTADQCGLLQKDSVFLLDSGAQYYDGTTDATRTIALGSPSAEIKDRFTTVLKAHIRLATATFPKTAEGCHLDTIARHVLWQHGLDFEHGTGHSVGHFSNVHEPFFNISKLCHNLVGENYVTSIEPGYYKENEYGIRIENLYYMQKAPMEGFLKFTHLTLIPIDKSLINIHLLDSGEQAWLNSYHQNVFSCLAPYLDTDEKEWLKEACSPL